MGYVSFPRDVAVRSLRWQPPFDTAQINRSEFSGVRQAVELPGGGRWRASGEFVPMIGQNGSLDLRRCLASLRGGLNAFALPAWEKRFSNVLATTAALQTVNPDTGVDMTGRTFTKTANTTAWDAQARSPSAITGGCIAHFRAGSLGKDLMAGINTDPFLDASFTSLDHAFYLNSSNFVEIYEGGSPIGAYQSYAVEDVFSIVYTGSAVKYFHNGHLLRSVAKSAGISFYFDSSFNSRLSSITDVAFTARTLMSAGISSFNLRSFDVSAANVLRGGQFATALCEDGSAQLLVVRRDARSDGGGLATIEVDAPLRKPAFAIITDYPFAHMALADGAEWGVDPGQIYSAGFTAEEAW